MIKIRAYLQLHENYSEIGVQVLVKRETWLGWVQKYLPVNAAVKLIEFSSSVNSKEVSIIENLMHWKPHLMDESVFINEKNEQFMLSCFISCGEYNEWNLTHYNAIKLLFILRKIYLSCKYSISISLHTNTLRFYILHCFLRVN